MTAMPVSLIPSFLVCRYVGSITLGPANLRSLSAAPALCAVSLVWPR